MFRGSYIQLVVVTIHVALRGRFAVMIRSTIYSFKSKWYFKHRGWLAVWFNMVPYCRKDVRRRK